MVRKISRRALALFLCLTMVGSLFFSGQSLNLFGLLKDVDAATSGVSTQTFGAATIANGPTDSDVNKLPTDDNNGTYRFTTDSYNSKYNTLPTTDWATNWLWDLEGDRYTDSTNAISGTAYALPLAYLMKKDGLRVNKPSMTSNATNISAYNIKDNDTLGEFNIYPDFTFEKNEIDDATDWTYVAQSSNSSGSKYMKTTMTQGVPFAYMELSGSTTLYIEKLRVTFPSTIVFNGTYNGCQMVVFRTMDITSSVNGFPSCTYQYYALYLPSGTTVTSLGTTDTTNNDGIGKLQLSLPSGRAYASLAWLCEGKSIDDNNGLSVAQSYRPYAFNFVKNTTANYSYNESTSTLSTTYTYTFDKKNESTADGTVMGILSHQYKNMSGYSYLSHKALTVRGYMKFLIGSSYTTNMTYTGILPYMPELKSSDTAGNQQLQNYVDNFVDTYLSGSGKWKLSNDEGADTYYHAKKLNRSAQAIAAAKAVGDDDSADKILAALENKLEDWFTYDGTSDKCYFTYLGDGLGTLLGFPTSFNAVDQLNDHHFHYGYFIEAAASVGLYDPEWLNEHKEVIKQLIYDIACPYRDEADSVANGGNAYPYLRSFSPYEGHSWASGYEDERTGNNQESTSEAMNAWGGIILFGEMTGDTEIRDLGIYLYTTEAAAAYDYWFDVDETTYKNDESKYTAPMASMVWGGKVDYATWFGEQYVQGIQICPINGWSFYLLQGGSDYIKKYYNADQTYENASGGSVSIWNDMWAEYYALADPATAMNSVWTKENVNDGDSYAHTYHFIESLINYGTPDLSFKCSSAMGTVFNNNGEYTYAVYNPTSSTQTVTFTAENGTQTTIKAVPNEMTLVNSNDLGNSDYTIEYYGKNLSGNDYSLISKEIKYADAGNSVTVSSKDIIGYTFDSSNSNNVMTASVSADGSTTFKLYYNRANYSISYNMNGGSATNSSLYPSSYTYGETYTLDVPSKEGYTFFGWYKDSEYKTKINSINEKTNGNLTLYAKFLPTGTILIGDTYYMELDDNYTATFKIEGDTKYSAANVLYRISDTEAEAKELADNEVAEGFVSWGFTLSGNTWTYSTDFKAYKDKYITFYYIRYDDNGGYKTDYAYGKISKEQTSSGGSTTTSQSSGSVTTQTVTTTNNQSSSGPLIPFGLNAYCSGDNTITVVWGQDDDRINNGQKYNIYIDDSIVLSSVSCGSYDINDVNAGDRTVKVTAVLNGVESDAVSSVVNVTGGNITTEKPTEAPTTTEKPTTTKAPETTTEKPTTTKAPETTTEEPTTTKAPETTTEEPTTKAPETITEEPETTTEASSSIAAPTGLVYAGNNDLPYYFAWSAVEGAESYNVYLNGILVTSVTGIAVNLDASLFTTSGNYTIGVSAVKGDEESAITETTKEFIIEVSTTAEQKEETTTIEEITEKPTEAPTEVETTTEIETESVNTDPSVITLSDDLAVEGFQISSTFVDSSGRTGGIRAVASVEPTINNSKVETWGLIYSITEYNGTIYEVSEDEMYVGCDNPFVKAYESTSNGTLNAVMGESGTATYFARTMAFGGSSKEVLGAKYKIRAYAILSNGQYVYSTVKSYSIDAVCDYLYQNCLMSTYDGHQFIFNNVLSVVNPEYKEVDYNWGNTIVKPTDFE